MHTKMFKSIHVRFETQITSVNHTDISVFKIDIKYKTTTSTNVK